MSKKPVRMMTREELLQHYETLSRQYGILLRSAGRTGVMPFIATQQAALAEAGAYLICRYGYSVDQITNMRLGQQEEREIG